jgi:single-stranded-DNA-specific exonuclease
MGLQVDEWIFTHDDVDGICAGALALAVCPGAQVYFTTPTGLLDDLSRAKDSDKIIICDISLDESNLARTLQRLRDISSKGDLTYIDHHPLPEDVSIADMPRKTVHKVGSAASELSYLHFQLELDAFHSRLAIYGAIGDYMDDTPVIKDLIKKWDKRTIYFEAGILTQGIEYLENDYESKRRILTILAKKTPPSLDEELVNMALLYTRREQNLLKDLKTGIRVEGHIAYSCNFPLSLGKTASYIKRLSNSPVTLAADEQNDKIEISVRRRDERVDLNKIMRGLTPKFDGSGGGHPAAAGGRIRKDSLPEFLKELNREVKAIVEKC